MAGKIFINYRHSDEPGFVQALYSYLEQAFRSERLFRDVDNIEPGLDFVRVLEEQVAECDLMISVIGKDWLDARAETGVRLLDDPDDFVRIEIKSALKQGKRVIPVLVGAARLPRSDELPETMKPLTRLHAVRLTHDQFRNDTQILIDAIQRILETAEAARDVQAEAARQPGQQQQANSQRPRPVRNADAKAGMVELKTSSPHWEATSCSRCSGCGKDALARFPDGWPTFW